MLRPEQPPRIELQETGFRIRAVMPLSVNRQGEDLQGRFSSLVAARLADAVWLQLSRLGASARSAHFPALRWPKVRWQGIGIVSLWSRMLRQPSR